MFVETIGRFEDDYLQRRLKLQETYVKESFQKGIDGDGILKIDILTTAYKNSSLLPIHIRPLIRGLWPGIHEVEVDDAVEEYMVMVLPILLEGSEETIFIVEDISRQEASYLDRNYWSMGYIWSTLILLAIICMVVTLIALRIAKPLRQIEDSLKKYVGG